MHKCRNVIKLCVHIQECTCVYACIYMCIPQISCIYICVCIHEYKCVYTCFVHLYTSPFFFYDCASSLRRTLSSILSSLVWTSAPACVLCQGSTLFVTWHPSSRLGHAPQPLQRVNVNAFITTQPLPPPLPNLHCLLSPRLKSAEGALSGHVGVFLFTGLGVRRQERTRSKKTITPKVLLLKIPYPVRPAQRLDTPHNKKYHTTQIEWTHVFT